MHAFSNEVNSIRLKDHMNQFKNLKDEIEIFKNKMMKLNL